MGLGRLGYDGEQDIPSEKLLGSLDAAMGPVKRKAALLLAQLQQEADPKTWPADITIDATGNGVTTIRRNGASAQPGQLDAAITRAEPPDTLPTPPLVRGTARPGELAAATAALAPPVITQRQAGAATARPPAGIVGTASAPTSDGATQPTVAQPAAMTSAQIYMREKMRGATDLEAALRATRDAQQMGDIRTSLREAGDMARTGRTDQTGFRAAMMDQAMNPLREFAARQDVGAKTMEEVKRRMEMQGADYALGESRRIAAENRDPNSARSKFAQSLLPTSVPPELRGRVTAEMVPQFKDLIDQYAPITKADVEKSKAPTEIAKLGVETGKLASEARLAEQAAPGTRAKTAAEAAKIREDVAAGPGARAKTAAETRKENAEAGIKEMEVGGNVAPGWVRGGNQKVEPGELTAFRTKVAGAKLAKDSVDRVLQILGNDNTITDPEKRAKASGDVKALLLNLKTMEGIRGLPAQDIAFLDSIVPDPTAINAANLTRISHNKIRFEQFRDRIDRDLQGTADSLGLKQTGAAEEAPKGAGDHDAALKWAMANPKDPRSNKILLRAASAKGLANAVRP